MNGRGGFGWLGVDCVRLGFQSLGGRRSGSHQHGLLPDWVGATITPALELMTLPSVRPMFACCTLARLRRPVADNFPQEVKRLTCVFAPVEAIPCGPTRAEGGA